MKLSATLLGADASKGVAVLGFVMVLYWILAFAAGLAAVAQGGVTKQLAKEAGLANVLHLSNLVALIGGLVILTGIISVSDGEIGKLLKGKIDFKTIGLWFLVPGLCGLFIITVGPFAIDRIGALLFFCILVFGQVIGSAIWDWKFEGLAFDRYRIIGVVLTLFGALSVSMSGEK